MNGRFVFSKYETIDCKMNVHKKCIPKVTKNCHGLLMQHFSPGEQTRTVEKANDVMIDVCR